MVDLNQIPANLPVPIDDGLADHLIGMQLPSLSLTATNGTKIDLSKIKGRLVVYCYPRTGTPNTSLPEGWDQIPGARGCTPQSCAYRDHYQEIKALDAEVFGLSHSQLKTPSRPSTEQALNSLPLQHTVCR